MVHLIASDPVTRLLSQRSGESERASGSEETVVGDNLLAEPPHNND